MSPVTMEGRLKCFKRRNKRASKFFTGSNIAYPNNEQTLNYGLDNRETLLMYTHRKSTKARKSSNKCQFSAANKLLSAKLRRRLLMIKHLSASVGEEPVVNVCSSSISECFICSICNGYLYKATTITECLHTFCKSCIVKHFAFHLNCPKCNILIHPTDPFVNIRSDSIMQDLLYKLLPNVEKEERAREHLFFEKMQTSSAPFIKVEKLSEGQGLPQSIQHKKMFKRKLSHDVKTEPTNVHVGFEVTFLGCCIENFTIKPPVVAYFSRPISSSMKDVQNFLEERLEIPSETQVNFFIDGFLINPLLSVEKLWNVFSNGDVLEDVLSISYAIMPNKDYFNEIKDCNS